MMRFFQINLLIIIILTSCTLSVTKNLREVANTTKEIINPYFTDPEKDYVYKASIEVYGNHFSGMLIIKLLKDNHHRIVFTTDMGKAFDFEIYESEFKINYIVEAMDRPLLINMLKKDFLMLLRSGLPNIKQFKTSQHTVFETVKDGKYFFYFFREADNQLDKIVKTSRSKEKVIISFSDINNDLPGKINLLHNDIKLAIDLKVIPNH